MLFREDMSGFMRGEEKARWKMAVSGTRKIMRKNVVK